MRYAFPLFLVSWIAVLVVTFENYALSNGLEVMGVGGAVFAGAIFLIAFGLIFPIRRWAVSCLSRPAKRIKFTVSDVVLSHCRCHAAGSSLEARPYV
jgi:membrane protein CcdC involved in cytochrome C biogenesis